MLIVAKKKKMPTTFPRVRKSFKYGYGTVVQPRYNKKIKFFLSKTYFFMFNYPF